MYDFSHNTIHQHDMHILLYTCLPIIGTCCLLNQIHQNCLLEATYYDVEKKSFACIDIILEASWTGDAAISFVDQIIIRIDQSVVTGMNKKEETTKQAQAQTLTNSEAHVHEKEA